MLKLTSILISPRLTPSQRRSDGLPSPISAELRGESKTVVLRSPTTLLLTTRTTF